MGGDGDSTSALRKQVGCVGGSNVGVGVVDISGEAGGRGYGGAGGGDGV